MNENNNFFSIIMSSLSDSKFFGIYSLILFCNFKNFWNEIYIFPSNIQFSKKKFQKRRKKEKDFCTNLFINLEKFVICYPRL